MHQEQPPRLREPSDKEGANSLVNLLKICWAMLRSPQEFGKTRICELAETTARDDIRVASKRLWKVLGALVLLEGFFGIVNREGWWEEAKPKIFLFSLVILGSLFLPLIAKLYRSAALTYERWLLLEINFYMLLLVVILPFDLIYLLPRTEMRSVLELVFFGIPFLSVSFIIQPLIVSGATGQPFRTSYSMVWLTFCATAVVLYFPLKWGWL